MDRRDLPQQQPGIDVSGTAGGLLLLLWLAAMAAGLAALHPRLRPSTDDPARIQRYLAALAAPAAPGTPIAYRIAGCDCRAAGDAASLRRRFQAAGFAFHELPAPALPLPYPLIVVDRDARLLYAGPLRWDGTCGNRDPLVPLVAALAGRPRPPLIVATDCPCS